MQYTTIFWLAKHPERLHRFNLYELSSFLFNILN